MSLLGVIVRTRAADLAATEAALRGVPGVDLARTEQRDGRLIALIEDTAACSAAETMAAIALWPRVLNVSLVYEYSGPDAQADGHAPH